MQRAPYIRTNNALLSLFDGVSGKISVKARFHHRKLDRKKLTHCGAIGFPKRNTGPTDIDDEFLLGHFPAACNLHVFVIEAILKFIKGSNHTPVRLLFIGRSNRSTK